MARRLVTIMPLVEMLAASAAAAIRNDE